MYMNQVVQEVRLCSLPIPKGLHESLMKIKIERKASLQSTILSILQEHIETREQSEN